MTAEMSLTVLPAAWVNSVSVRSLRRHLGRGKLLVLGDRPGEVFWQTGRKVLRCTPLFWDEEQGRVYIHHADSLAGYLHLVDVTLTYAEMT